MARVSLGVNVFDAALGRLQALAEDGHRLVVSFSTGKDSGVCVELALLALRAAGRREPLDVVMRDEEILYPGSFEYAERLAARSDISFRWVVAHQPIINVFNREQPYWWVFDPLLPPEAWVRQPPPFVEKAVGMSIQSLTNDVMFPPPPGKRTYVAVGLRADESQRRTMAVHAAGGHLLKAKPGSLSVGVRPIYDWGDADIWKAIKDFKWDYNEAYDHMYKLGVPRHALRIAPPTMSAVSVTHLGVAARIWPKWFDRVCSRVPGVRTAAHFGKRAVQPRRRLGETWEACYWRTCVDEAPEWIAERARFYAALWKGRHAAHATTPIPETEGCPVCGMTYVSWKRMTLGIYNGDPFAQYTSGLKEIEPEFFRAGAGKWGGKPAW